MKKKYIIPVTETVNVRLHSSVLEEGDFGKYSTGAGGEQDDNGENWADGKQQSGIIFDDGSLGDIWGGGDSNNPYDLWGE